MECLGYAPCECLNVWIWIGFGQENVVKESRGQASDSGWELMWLFVCSEVQLCTDASFVLLGKGSQMGGSSWKIPKVFFIVCTFEMCFLSLTNSNFFYSLLLQCLTISPALILTVTVLSSVWEIERNTTMLTTALCRLTLNQIQRINLKSDTTPN